MDLNTLMGAMRSTRRHWIDWYPVREDIISGASLGNGDVLLVDIGGGLGHDARYFVDTFPVAKGHTVLQDLRKVLDSASNFGDGIEAMPHDFFTPQPVQG